MTDGESGHHRACCLPFVFFLCPFNLFALFPIFTFGLTTRKKTFLKIRDNIPIDLWTLCSALQSQRRSSNTSVFTHVIAAGYLTLECCVDIDSFRKHWSASAALLASFRSYVQYWTGKAFDCHHPFWVPPLLNPSGHVKALPRVSV